MASSSENTDADDDAAETAPHRSFLPIPFYFYTPETKSAFGFTASYLYRPAGPPGEVRPSSIGPTFVYTVRDQIIVSLLAELYPNRGAYRIAGWLEYMRFPTFYWGIGNETPDTAEEPYTPRWTGGELQVQRRVGGSWYVGAVVTAGYRELLEVEPDGLLDDDATPGAYDGRVASVGVLLTRDGRDSIIYPTSGSFRQLRSSVFNSSIGSDYDLARHELDVRGYRRFAPRSAVALRMLLQTTTGSPPFDLLPALGGDQLLRGYFEGRYRDRHLIAVQGECRLHVWRRLGVVGFAAAGQVAPTLRELRPGASWVAVGGGIRFRVNDDEGLNARLDFGQGTNTSGIYLAIGEAF